MKSATRGLFALRSSSLLVFVALTFAVGRGATIGASDSPVQVGIGSGFEHSFLGWGLTVAPVTDDGAAGTIFAGAIPTTYQDLGITFANVEWGLGPIYDSRTHLPNSMMIKTSLLPVLKALQSGGVKEYVLTVVSPPKSMKKYYSDYGEVEMEPNSLRPDKERDFAEFIVEVLKLVREYQSTLPTAISLVERPDSGERISMQGAQWRQIIARCRERLSSSGFGDIGIVGPDTTTIESLGDFLDPSICRLLRAVSISEMRSTDWTIADSMNQAALIDKVATEHSSRWVLDAEMPMGDRAFSVASLFRTLTSDMTVLRCNRWFWHSVISSDDWSKTPLDHLDGSNGRLPDALRFLWQLTSGPMTVHRLAVSSNENITPALEGFCLVAQHRKIIVIINCEDVDVIGRFAVGIGGAPSDAVRLFLSDKHGNNRSFSTSASKAWQLRPYEVLIASLSG